MNCAFVLIAWLLVMTPRSCDGSIFREQKKNGRLVTSVLQILHLQFPGCHIVLATTNSYSQNLNYLIYEMTKGGDEAMVVFDGTSVPFTQRAGAIPLYREKRKQSGLWSEAQATCRVLLLDFSYGNILVGSSIFEWAALWTQPDTQLVVIGDRAGVTVLLLHPTLRNTRNALYVTKQTPSKHDSQREGVGVEVWRRCGYCEGGEAGVERLGIWNETKQGIPGHSSLFRDQPENYNRYKFRIVERDYFPYMSWDRLSDNPGSLVRHKDAIGTRVLQAMSSSLNFTYEVREPADRQWGLEGEGGNWTGMVGELQREVADICTDLTVVPRRGGVIQFAGAYTAESMVILSSKPRPLPEYLSLIRPFEREVWLAVLAIAGVWGATLWLFQKVWSLALGGKALSLSSSLFYSWSVMLEDPPTRPPKNLTGQLLVGWWLTGCLVMTSSYRSSLISHLVVQGKSPVINSVKELVGRDEWRWGTQRMTGAIKPYLKSSPNPDMRKLYYQMQIKSIEEGMTLVLGGGFAFVHTNYLNMQILVAAYYTDKIGYTPIHISTSKYPLFSGNSFGIRPGAPFLRRFRLTRQRLLEGGLMSFWTYDVMNTRKRQLRQEQLSNKQSSEIPNIIQAGGGQVVLGFQHLLGAFVVLALGSILACLSFVTETFGCFN